MRSNETWWRLSLVASHLPVQLQSLSAFEPRLEGRRAAIQRPGSTGVQASLPPVMATKCAAWTVCVTACNRALSFVLSLDPINTPTAPASSVAQSTLACDRQEPRPPASAPLASAARHVWAVLRTPRAALMRATIPFRSPSVHRQCRFLTAAVQQGCSAARSSRQTGARAQQERAVSLRERWTDAKVKGRVSVRRKHMKRLHLCARGLTEFKSVHCSASDASYCYYCIRGNRHSKQPSSGAH